MITSINIYPVTGIGPTFFLERVSQQTFKMTKFTESGREIESRNLSYNKAINFVEFFERDEDFNIDYVED